MKKVIISSFCLAALASAVAFAQPKPGQYTGVRECKGSANGVDADATSKKTIGVASCKLELQRKLIEAGACSGKKPRERVEYSFTFGKDGEPNQASGTGKLSCP